MSVRARAIVALLAAAAVLVLPAAAPAAITETIVATPSVGTKVIYDDSVGAAPTTVTFSGGSNASSASDTIRLLCVNRSADGGSIDTSWSLATNVPTDDVSGAWSVDVSVSGGDLAGTCLVRAVDHSAPLPPASLAGTSGPTMSFTRTEQQRVTAGINAGKVFSWTVDGAFSEAYVQVMSPQFCGLCATLVYTGAELQRSEQAWRFEHGLWGDGNQPIKSDAGLTVDELHVYTPDAASNRSFNGVQGKNMPGLEATSVDIAPQVDGSMKIVESMPLVRCNGGADQATPTAACTALVPSGVSLTRTWMVSPSGRRTSMTDVFASTDAASHAVKAQYWTSPADDALFELSWVSGGAPFLVAGDGSAIATPPSAPWSMLARDDDAMAGVDSAQYPYSADVTSVAPSSLVQAKTYAGYVLPVTSLNVPAGGTATVERSTLAAVSRSEATTFQATEIDRMVKPVLALSTPTEGTLYEAAPIVVSGTATDNVGVTSLAVNGVATPVTAGAFSTAITPVAGANTVTVVAKDAGGNEVTVTRTFTFRQKTFTGTAKNDKLVGNAGSNILNGFAGNDTIDCGAGGKDVANGGAGNDKITCVEPLATAKANADTVNCGPGKADVAVVDPFDKVIGCEFVTRVWIGGSKADKAKGTKANDKFDLKGGNDTVVCGGGTDTVALGAGNDVVNCVDRGKGAKKSKDVVNCGPGKQDVATVDKFDKVIGCERVKRVGRAESVSR